MAYTAAVFIYGHALTWEDLQDDPALQGVIDACEENASNWCLGEERSEDHLTSYWAGAYLKEIIEGDALDTICFAQEPSEATKKKYDEMMDMLPPDVREAFCRKAASIIVAVGPR